MEIITEIANKVFTSFIGVTLYYLIKFIPYLSVEAIKTKVFWNAMWLTAKIKTLWLFVTITLLSVVIVKMPMLADAIQQSLGLEINTNIASFFTLGVALAGMIDNNPKKPKI